MDEDNDNIVTDQEWFAFFSNFIEPFQKCDKDDNWKLSPQEMFDCIKNTEDSD